MLRIQSKIAEEYYSATEEDLHQRVGEIKKTLGDQLFILGHHYQRDSVMVWADARGDSFKLAQLAKEKPEAKYIVFCGVHFMAESADILTAKDQQVLLPDLNAGCSMADMADLEDVEVAWESLAAVTDIERMIPITYMNSSADIKAFVGRNGGAVCTSSNAHAILKWALGKGDQILFFPDQHLGRNTGYDLGFGTEDMHVWNPRFQLGGLEERHCKEATLLLWKGHCSIHQRFTAAQIAEFREEHPQGLVVAHPECPHEVCEAADSVGSTEKIIQYIADAPSGATIGVGTEIHLVNRLNNENLDKTILSLDPIICPCATMGRIDLPHLTWILDGLAEGKVRNQITVPDDIASEAVLALERMLAIC